MRVRQLQAEDRSQGQTLDSRKRMFIAIKAPPLARDVLCVTQFKIKKTHNLIHIKGAVLNHKC